MNDLTKSGPPIPAEPDWFASINDELEIDTARFHWRGIVAEMTTANTITPENGHAIRRLVEARLLYERASKQVMEHGAVVRAPKTGTPMHSPFFTVMNKAATTCERIEAELGLAPTRRDKAKKIERKQRAWRPADEFLRPRKD